MISSFFTLLTTLSSKLGYWGILLLMTIESSFVPFPSEIVVPPAAYLASQGEMNIFLVVFFGILGSLIGATINYYLARSLGRRAVYFLIEKRFFKLLFLDKEKIEKSENYFLKYGRSSTFFGRLVPAVRQLISIPAGFSKMPFGTFILYTGLGSGIWVIVLALMGYFLGENKELLAKYYEELKYAIIFLFLVFVGYTGVNFWVKRKSDGKKNL